MGLNRQDKAVVVENVGALVAKAQSIVIAEYRGLEVAKITVLRANARKAGVSLQVLKNTLARRAVAGTPYEKLTDQMVGPLMYGIANDPVSAAKVMHDFAKTNDKFVIKAGALPNFLMNADGVKALASLPSRDELLSKLMGTMQAPVTKFVQTLNEIPTKFARGLAAVRDAKEANAQASAPAPAAASEPVADAVAEQAAE